MTLIGSNIHVTKVWGREENGWPGPWCHDEGWHHCTVVQWSDCGQWCSYLWTVCFECFQYRETVKVWVGFVYSDLDTKLYPLLFSGGHSFYSLWAFAFETCFIMSDQVRAELSFLWLCQLQHWPLHPAPAQPPILAFPFTLLWGFLLSPSDLPCGCVWAPFSMYGPRNRKYCRWSCYHQRVLNPNPQMTPGVSCTVWLTSVFVLVLLPVEDTGDIVGWSRTSWSGDHCVVGDGCAPPAVKRQQCWFLCVDQNSAGRLACSFVGDPCQHAGASGI